MPSGYIPGRQAEGEAVCKWGISGCWGPDNCTTGASSDLQPLQWMLLLKGVSKAIALQAAPWWSILHKPIGETVRFFESKSKEGYRETEFTAFIFTEVLQTCTSLSPPQCERECNTPGSRTGG